MLDKKPSTITSGARVCGSEKPLYSGASEREMSFKVSINPYDIVLATQSRSNGDRGTKHEARRLVSGRRNEAMVPESEMWCH